MLGYNPKRETLCRHPQTPILEQQAILKNILFVPLKCLLYGELKHYTLNEVCHRKTNEGRDAHTVKEYFGCYCWNICAFSKDEWEDFVENDVLCDALVETSVDDEGEVSTGFYLQ